LGSRSWVCFFKWLTLDLEPSFPNRYGRCGGFAFVRVKSTTLGHNPYRFFGRQQWLFDIAHASLASEHERSKCCSQFQIRFNNTVRGSPGKCNRVLQTW
jgi:hypothetical protein